LSAAKNRHRTARAVPLACGPKIRPSRRFARAMVKTPPANALFFQEPKTLAKQHQDSYKLSNDRWMAPCFPCFLLSRTAFRGLTAPPEVVSALRACEKCVASRIICSTVLDSLKLIVSDSLTCRPEWAETSFAGAVRPRRGESKDKRPGGPTH